MNTTEKLQCRGLSRSSRRGRGDRQRTRWRHGFWQRSESKFINFRRNIQQSMQENNCGTIVSTAEKGRCGRDAPTAVAMTSHQSVGPISAAKITKIDMTGEAGNSRPSQMSQPASKGQSGGKRTNKECSNCIALGNFVGTQPNWSRTIFKQIIVQPRENKAPE